jgi:hypothetical protein
MEVDLVMEFIQQKFHYMPRCMLVVINGFKKMFMFKFISDYHKIAQKLKKLKM